MREEGSWARIRRFLWPLAAVLVAGQAMLTPILYARSVDAARNAKASAVSAEKAARSATLLAQANRAVIDAIAKEAATRERQFCRLIIAAHRDRETRLRNTREYLKTPAGRERTALNEYIRQASLPQLVQEVRKERKRLPRVCHPQKSTPTHYP